MAPDRLLLPDRILFIPSPCHREYTRLVGSILSSYLHPFSQEADPGAAPADTSSLPLISDQAAIPDPCEMPLSYLLLLLLRFLAFIPAGQIFHGEAASFTSLFVFWNMYLCILAIHFSMYNSGCFISP